jgi:hypothetical protein
MMRATLVVFLISGCAGSLADVPAPAAAALQRQAGGAELRGFEKETANGVELYEAGWKDGGVHHEAKVTADGDLVELEESVGADTVPVTVRDAAAKRYGQAAKLHFVKKTWVVYEVEATVGGVHRETIFTPTGATTREIDDDDDDGDDADGADGDDADDDDGDP